MEKTFSKVKIIKTSEIKEVDIFKASSVTIKDAVIKRWQNSIDHLARLCDVPAVLIMRLHEEEIEVFLASQTDGNPYPGSAKDELLQGFYCETVIGTNSSLAVENALEIPEWKENPDIKLNMISYLGYPLKWPGGEFYGTICILDIVPRKFDSISEDLLQSLQQSIETDLALLLSQNELAEREARLKILIEEKDRFFSILAHDLRSPFTTLLAYSETLPEELSNGDIESSITMANAINTSANSAFRLLENLLDWSRLNRNILTAAPRPLDLLSVTRTVFEELKSPTVAKGIDMILRIPPGLTVNADKHMLSGIIRNLLSNSIKFTQRGGTVNITASVEEDNLIMKFEDSGIGMSPEIISGLFTRIKPGRKGTDGESSSGLGLNIVKEFVEKHHGTISVTSTEGVGSVFTVRMPVG